MTPPQLLQEITRLYHQLEAIPWFERPEAGRSRYASAAYVALETQIRMYAEQFKQLTNEDEVLTRRVTPGEVELEAPRRRCG